MESRRHMPLDSGTRLGPYEILAPLGAGGMGEVYRASKSILHSHPPGVLFHAFAVSRDGRRFLIPRPLSAATTDDSAAAPVAVAVVLNWAAGLK